MNVPATLSVTNVVVALLAAILTGRISTGPGWRELRYFALAALAAALFSAHTMWLVLPVSDGVKTWCGRMNLGFAGLHGCAWILYYAGQARRSLLPIERGVLGFGLVLALLAFVPGVMSTRRLFDRHVDWLSVTYRDLVPTQAGELMMVFACAVLVWLAALYIRRWRQGRAGRRRARHRPRRAHGVRCQRHDRRVVGSSARCRTSPTSASCSWCSPSARR
ncbi:MAG: hypothetical protein U0235_01405 [Polyangiaceae bacterium]